MKLRVGSRESKLAQKQAQIVINAIKKQDPGIEVELVTMKTTGDKDQDQPMDAVGIKGLFVKELDQALLEGKVDICVHSLKDLPLNLEKGIGIVAVGRREDPRDVLVLPRGIEQLPVGYPIGCSSKRRMLQLQWLFPQNPVMPIRGNVETRIAKLDQGVCGGLVLASAGLKRLGLTDRITSYFSVEQMVPACGQGIIAVTGRKGEAKPYLTGFHDSESWDISVSERAYLRVLGGGCSSPITAYGKVMKDRLILTGYNVDAKGQIVPGTFSGKRENAFTLGLGLGAYLKVEAEKRGK